MSALYGWWTRLRRTLRPRSFDAEMEAEMRAHQELEAAALRKQGLAPDEAGRVAAVRFGSMESYKEDVRDRRLAQWLHDGLADVRYALRQFRNAPSFTAIAVATLAIGIGASTAIFSTLDGVLFRPLPYPEPDRVMLVFEVIPGNRINNASGGAYIDWRTHQTTFDSLCLTTDVSRNVRYGDTLERLDGTEVTHEYFRVFGIKALLGRTFAPENDKPGGDTRVVVLTEQYWHSRFGGSPSILGSTVVLDEVPHTVIGVVPRDFIEPKTQFFVPAVAEPSEEGRFSRSFHWAIVAGRLAPGVSAAQAEAELISIKQRLEASYPVWKKDWSVAVREPRPLITRQIRPLVYVLTGAVALVLLIACANVANLLLARATQREQELALRSALGATSGRLFRQVLTESVLLALLGGIAGVLTATWTIDVIRSTTAALLPPAIAPQMDPRVLVAALAISVFTGVLFGMLPAWRVRRTNLNETLKNGGRSASAGGRSRSQSILIIAEVALSVVLLSSAGLLLRSLGKAISADAGFEPDRVLAFDLSLPPLTYQTPETRLAFSKQLQERLNSLPGVERAGTGMSLPFAGGGYGETFSPAEEEQTYSHPNGRLDFVSPGYLETLGARLLAGRWLLPTDNRADGPRVGIVNDTVARRLYGDEMPVGRKIRISGTLYEIVGVIRTLPDKKKDDPAPLFLYAPQAFDPAYFSVVVRTTGSPETFIPNVREVVRQLDPGLAMAHVRTLDQAMHGSMKLRRVVLAVIGGFAVSSLVLACIGLYGVMAYTVGTRLRELSIRMALGAQRRDVLLLVMKDGMKLILVGLVLGLALALASSRLLSSQLYGISARDPLGLAGALLVLTAVAAFACWWPALRATRAKALTVLRAD